MMAPALYYTRPVSVDVLPVRFEFEAHALHFDSLRVVRGTIANNGKFK